MNGTFKEGDLAINKGGAHFKSEGDKTHDRHIKLETTADPMAEFEALKTLGAGSSGVVKKVRHIPTGNIFAMKSIPLDTKDEKLRKAILVEVRSLHQAESEYIVRYHGAFHAEGAINIALEYMDASLHDVIKKVGPVPEGILARISHQLLSGLQYLHHEQHIVHRDIKPSNLLINFVGDVKIADFGVSGQLANSIAKATSFVGTVTYMSPERIRGGDYAYNSDVWALGLSLVELATGQFPYPRTSALGFWELLDYIVSHPAPTLPDTFSGEMSDFVARCLQKEANDRATAAELLKHPWIANNSTSDAEVKEWVSNSVQDIKAYDAKKRADQAKLELAHSPLPAAPADAPPKTSGVFAKGGGDRAAFEAAMKAAHDASEAKKATGGVRFAE